jgi:methyl-accepting chemotaxis protein
MTNLDTFTIVACCVIFVAFIAAWLYVANTSNEELPKRRKWIDQLPSIISTLGVLGTFLGITRGLVSFNTATLDLSIPILLDGLKTAFFTSLLGMTGSLILNRIVSAKFDKEQKSSDIEKAARMIIDAMNANQRELPRLFKDSNENLVSTLSKDETVKVIRQDVEQLKDDLEEIKGLSQELRDIAKGLSGINQEIKKTLANVSTSNSSIAEELPRLRAVAVTATASISALDNNVHDIEAAVSTINTNVADMTERLETDMEEIKSSVSSIYIRQDEIKDAIADIHSGDEEEEGW